MKDINKISSIQIVIALICLLCIAGCPGSNSSETESLKKNEPPQIRREKATIEKTVGINVGESESIWGVGLENAASVDNYALNIYRLELNPLKGYPVDQWTYDVPGFTRGGTRTYVSRFGLLMGRAGTGGVMMLLLDPDQPADEAVKEIFRTTEAGKSTRATPLSYKVRRNGVDYEFIALAFKADDISHLFRIERFLYQDGEFVRMTPYVFSAPEVSAAEGVYTAFLSPCSEQENGECAPLLFGGVGHLSQFFGISLTLDVPPTPYSQRSTPIIPEKVPVPNETFVSTSHSETDSSNWGVINKGVYSVSGDPETGDLFRFAFSIGSKYANFTSYDRVNELVFVMNKNSKLKNNGTAEAGSTNRSVVQVFKKECFTSEVDCSPVTTDRSRIFDDVGEFIGPTSDLGIGCVAALGWVRPNENKIDQSNFRAGVYKLCARDANDLDKGIVSIKIGEFKGATYMYNDFTGATLYDQNVRMLFDFKESDDIYSISDADFHWIPKAGFSTTPKGLIAGVRCYEKGAAPPAFETISLGLGYILQNIPGCNGIRISQVEFEIEREMRSKFTRFESFSVTVEKM